MFQPAKKILTILFLGLSTTYSPAQWCTPSTLIPYAPSMPGITHVTLNTINRTSAPNEHGNGNNYTNTNLSTTLVPGSAYSISITHNIDASICPDMNLRVWIDYNQDYQLNDVGETVISVDHHPPGTYSGNFTVPLSALPGITRMRITAKMSNLGGHSLPDPCDIPADPLGYHGEMEDYTIQVATASQVQDISSGIHAIRVYPTPVTSDSRVSFYLDQPGHVTIELLNTEGIQMTEFSPSGLQTAGYHNFALEIPETRCNGFYFLKIFTEQTVAVLKLAAFRD